MCYVCPIKTTTTQPHRESRKPENRVGRKYNLTNKTFNKQQNIMKKQVKKITLKTDKIVNLSNAQAQKVQGGRPVLSHTELEGTCTCPKIYRMHKPF
jgi:hypothetical protein